MPPCCDDDLCQSVFSRGLDHKWEASPPPQTSLASGQVNLTISQSPTLTKLSVCQIFRDRIMKTHNLIWSIHWHTPKNGIEHQVKSTWQLISPRLTKLSVCQIFTDRIMKTHNIGRSIHWHIPKDGIEPAWEVWQLSEGDWSLPLEWQFSRNWSGDDRWLWAGWYTVGWLWWCTAGKQLPLHFSGTCFGAGILRQTQKVNIARRRKMIQSLFG